MNPKNRAIFISGFVALLFTHLAFLTQVGGWHLDEAWAGNFAHRIAFENGFWPLQAMSPYTTAWSHYLVAFVFHVLGTSVWTYRATGIAEVSLGIALLSAALAKKGEEKAASLLPGVIAFFPTLVIDHRWVIEMNTFFVLCAGLMAYGIASRKNILTYVGVFLGITSHVLFLAPCLALLYWSWVDGSLSSKVRKELGILAFILGLFFLRVFFSTNSDDHIKALELIGVTIATIMGLFTPSPREKTYFFTIPAFLGSFLLIPFLIFIEGSWTALFSIGALKTGYLMGLILIPAALLIFYSRPKIPREMYWLPYCLILTLAMVVKPGPRYYEVPFLFCAVLIAIGLSRITASQARRVLILWFGIGSLQLSINYFRPALAEVQMDRTFYLSRFHDSSTDMLPTQRVARRLASEGCDYSDLDLTRDDRMDQCLKFLSYGDWPKVRAGGCSFGHHVHVTRTPGNEGQFTIQAN